MKNLMLLLAAFVLGILAVPAPAQNSDRLTRDVNNSIQSLLRREWDRDCVTSSSITSRVDNDRGEDRIEGVGRANGKGGKKPENYSFVTFVSRGGYAVRGTFVRFDTGKTFGSNPGPGPSPERPGDGRGEVNITYPTYNSTVNRRSFTLSGNSPESDSVNVSITRGGREVFGQRVRADRGRFSVDVRLDDGSYVAVATSGRSTSRVVFSVDANGSGGGNGRNVDVTYPTYNSTVDSNRFTVSGNAPGFDSVDVTISRDGREVFHRRADVYRDRFSVDVRLDNGEYEVRAVSNRSTSTVKFKVSSGSNGDNGRNVDVTYPTYNSTVNANNFTITGNAPGFDSVEVTVRQNGREVFYRRVDVNRDRFSVDVRLPLGEYELQAVSGRSTSTVKFKVSGSFSSNPDLRINSPINGAKYRKGILPFTGSSPEDRVVFYLYRGQKLVSEKILTATKGRWITSVRVEPGDYRLVVTSGSATSSANFQVD